MYEFALNFCPLTNYALDRNILLHIHIYYKINHFYKSWMETSSVRRNWCHDIFLVSRIYSVVFIVIIYIIYVCMFCKISQNTYTKYISNIWKFFYKLQTIPVFNFLLMDFLFFGRESVKIANHLARIKRVKVTILYLHIADILLPGNSWLWWMTRTTTATATRQTTTRKTTTLAAGHICVLRRESHTQMWEERRERASGGEENGWKMLKKCRHCRR